MADIARVLVFCGSNPGLDVEYLKQAYAFGELLATEGKTLVYGGGDVGCMGALADGALEAGGEVIGVIPEFLTRKEVMHRNLSQTIIVETMHQRKLKMSELADAVVALPGGFGTLDELFEMLTWSQLSLHQKPIGLLNVQNFYSPLLAMVEHMVSQAFVPAHHRQLLLSHHEAHTLLAMLEEASDNLPGHFGNLQKA
jgi:uncharacterized protein (TIGR00730 family)